MRSSFFGLNVATQGLYTAMGALDVVNHNISNAETKGYSRQYVVQKATRPLPNTFRGMVGTGTEITNVLQYRSTYIDTKYWYMNKDLGQYTVKKDMMTQIELLFNEPSDSGYSAQINLLFNRLQDLSKTPAESAPRANLVDSLQSFTQYFNNIYKMLSDQQREANYGVKTCVEEINFLASQIASASNQIANLELTGAQANDLRDERANLLDRLSQIINIDAQEWSDVNGKKHFSVSINGQYLVDDTSVTYLNIVPRDKKNNVEDQADLYDIVWSNGKNFYINESTSGELKGYLDVRDGNNGENFKGTISSMTISPPAASNTITVRNFNINDLPAAGKITINNQDINYSSYTYTVEDVAGVPTPTIVFELESPPPAGGTKVTIGESVKYKGIPYYIKQLNEFVRTLARNFNQLHRTGTDANGNTGGHLFTFDLYSGIGDLTEYDNSSSQADKLLSIYSYNKITIENFTVNADIVKNNDLLMTSVNGAFGESKNDIILAMLDLRHDTNMFEKGEPDSFMLSLIGELGINAKQADSFYNGQRNLVRLIDQQRKSISSVNINEETTDLIRFQQAYQLSAKVISVMDEIYDVTINQLIR